MSDNTTDTYWCALKPSKTGKGEIKKKQETTQTIVSGWDRQRGQKVRAKPSPCQDVGRSMSTDKHVQFRMNDDKMAGNLSSLPLLKLRSPTHGNLVLILPPQTCRLMASHGQEEGAGEGTNIA